MSDSVVDQVPFTQIIANGVTTVFGFTFQLLEVADLVVYGDGVVIPSSNYTLSGIGVQAGGSVTFLVAPANGVVILLSREIALARTTEYQTLGDFKATVVNPDFNRLWMALQGFGAKIGGAIRLPYPEQANELPSPSSRAGFLLGFDGAGAIALVASAAQSATALALTLLTSAGATLVGYIEAGAGAILRTVQARLRDSVSMKGFGAVGDGVTNDSAAVALALATGSSLVIPEGDYLVDNLTWTASNRKLIALGRVRFIKRANGPILTMSGANNTLQGIEFWGDAAAPVFTGDNLVISGDSNTLIDCGSRWASGRALKCTGNQLNLIGTCDVYQTADATATGYDIEIGGAALTLYHRITDIRTSQATGGILLTNTGAASIKGSQFGKLTADKGVASAGNHGPYVTGCRINGATDIQQSNTGIDCSSASANVTIGDNLSGVSLGDSFLMASGTTVTVGSGLSSCELDVLAKLEDGGVTVTIGATTLTGPNNIGITEKTFAAAISAVGGAPALGNGTLTMYYSRRGRRYNVSYRFTFGSTTNMGTGTFYISLPVVPRNTIARIGTAQVLDAGTALFVAAVQALADGTARMSFTTHGAASQVTNLVPMTWATSDDMQGSVEFDV